MQNQSWPAHAVESRGIETLSPYEQNARKHSKAQIQQLAASVQEWGWTIPILIDEEGLIIAGHGRLEAARLLGLKEVPCMTARGWTKAQKRAYVIADNQLTLAADWNDEVLQSELRSLVEEGFATELLGFEERDLDAILDLEPDKGNDADAEELLEEEAVSQEGDVWVCGEHRVRCGDSTNAEHVQDLLRGEVPFIMVTDPPYGVNYDPAWRSKAAEEGHLAYAARRVGKVRNDDRADWQEAYELFEGAVAYVWCPSGNLNPVFAATLEAAGFELRTSIVWSKPHFPIGRSHYHQRHETCWYAVRKGQSAKWIGGRKQTTIWDVTLDQNVDGGHSTQKPVECMARPIRNHGVKGDVVYDPFLGSGTTLIACEDTGRRCRGMELEPRYVDVIVRRWQKKTGSEATLEENGATFENVSHARDTAEDVFG